MGNEESEGEKAGPEGEGKRGSMSGERGAPGNIVGAAEMVETYMLCGEEEEANDDEGFDAIKARKIIAVAGENDQKEGIIK